MTLVYKIFLNYFDLDNVFFNRFLNAENAASQILLTCFQNN